MKILFADLFVAKGWFWFSKWLWHRAFDIKTVAHNF